MPLAAKPSIADLDRAVARLELQPDGDSFSSPSSLLRPVTVLGRPALLKVTNEPEELAGSRALEKWDGNGAVRVLARDGNAVVLERAGRPLRSLVSDDGAATRVLCAVARRLHGHTLWGLDEFPSLRRWFSSLFRDTHPRFDRVRAIADRLLDRSTSPILLHGDLHHDNVLDGAGRGWLAIDPKGIVGAREFDYCNIFTNWAPRQAVEHFDSRLGIVAATAAIDRCDLLRWVASWSALSGIWHLEDGDEARAAFPHTIMELALARLRAHGGPRSD
ncbi:MAG: aminoglycoside phosphotransferase family protein [Candidatus Dormiibacterota bacterium]